jgi:hypothetical protein
MRKTVGLVLLGLAGFLLTTAVLTLVYVPGAVEKTPLDTDTVTRLGGDAAVLPVGDPGAVKAISHTVSDGEASDATVVVFDTFSCLMRDVAGSPDCTEDDGEGSPLVTAGTDRFATDRHTAEAVDDVRYVGTAAVPHQGLVNKWPFNPEQKTYAYWDGLLGRTVDAAFSGEEAIDGLATYKYQVSVQEEPAEVAGGVSGVYSTDKTLWIDTVTGSIIDQKEHQVRALDDGTTVLDVNLGFTPDTVSANVDDAKANGSQLSLVRAAPWVLGLLGLLALVGGAFLALAGRRSEQ